MAAETPANSGVPVGQDVFVAEFRRWRDLSGKSRTALATAMGYSRSYVSKVESGNEHASWQFAKIADTVLNTGGALLRAWREQETVRVTPGITRPAPVSAAIEQAGGLLVEHDHAELYYDGNIYRLTQRRRLVNHDDQPITRYLIRISIDRYPGDPERSNQLYRENPLSWDEINLRAWHGDQCAEEMTWSVQHARYHLEWYFRNRPDENLPDSPRPSAVMRALGIVQDGDPALRRPARPLTLPSEAEDARRVISELQSAIHRITKIHAFGKGVGIAAPQIGIERAAAIVRPSGSNDVITLLNPRIIESSAETDKQYEGCLSFFDVRCPVLRPLVISVEHQDITGERRVTIFERGIARLVAHEVDHLHGILCRDHMPEGVAPIPVEQYRGTGTSWNYPDTRDQMS